MTYTIYTTPAGRAALRKLPEDVRQHLQQALVILETQPNSGEQLKGHMRFLRSLHTRFNNTDYRVAYEIIERAKEILIHFAGPRENFYKRLEKMRLPVGKDEIAESSVRDVVWENYSVTSAPSTVFHTRSP